MQIAPVSPVPADIAPSAAIATTPIPAQDFSAVLTEQLARVNGDLQAADTQAVALAAGRDVPVHDVMIAMEQARLDLMLVVEVRNRLIEAYQELTRMQL